MSDSTENVARKLEMLALDDGERLLQKYGIINEYNELTDEGKKVLQRLTLNDYKKAIVADLEKLEAEAKGVVKKAKK